MNDRFNDNTKEEVRLRTDIGTVVGRYVALKRRGGSLMGLCPFHKEKSPSFTVSPDRGMFYCFGCGKGGDVFRFVQDIEGVDFREALEMLAEEAGVKIEKRQRRIEDRYDDSRYDDQYDDDHLGGASPQPSSLSQSRQSGSRASKTEMFAIHNDAAEFFYNKMKGNQRVINYFKERGLTGETVREFRLGYAPAGWSELCDYLRGKGIPQSKIIECGLAVSKDTGSFYDRFRDRVMFPLRDVSGRIVGFAGRGMDADTQPKYLNSPETAIYKKSGILYGMNIARQSVRDLGFLMIVEGYMDCLTLYQAGIRNAAAVSGTAFTAEHAQLIRRAAKRVTFVFDGDAAGQRAAQRALFVLAPFDLQASVLILPGSDDPDSFVKREGSEAFMKLLKNTAKTAEDFLIDKLVSETDGSPHGKSAAINELVPYARALTDTIVRGAFVDKLALRLRIDRRHIIERLNKLPAAGTANPDGGDSETRAAPIAIGGLEESFLRILITKPKLIEYARAYVLPENLSDPLSADIYSIILKEYAETGDLSGLPDICGGGTEAGRAVSMLAVKPALLENIDKELVQKVLLLRKKDLKARIAEVRECLKECQDEQKGSLMEELKDLGAQLKELESLV